MPLIGSPMIAYISQEKETELLVNIIRLWGDLAGKISNLGVQKVFELMLGELVVS